MGLFSRHRRGTTGPEIEKVVNAFGKCLKTRTSVLCDVAELPYPKETIKLALAGAIKVTSDATAREQLSVGLVTLADFQDLENCKRYGLEATKLMLWEGEALLKLARSIETK